MRLRTLDHIHPPLCHAPSSSNSITCIRYLRRLPLYILLSLSGMATNDLVSIVINLISETLYGQNREGLFQLNRKFFNAK